MQKQERVALGKNTNYEALHVTVVAGHELAWNVGGREGVEDQKLNESKGQPDKGQVVAVEVYALDVQNQCQ